MLTVERMCYLAGVSRASYYRHLVVEAPDEAETTIRSVIQEVALEHHRRCGYRRVTFELQHHRGIPINHKRVLRIMREDNLLAIRHRRHPGHAQHQSFNRPTRLRHCHSGAV